MVPRTSTRSPISLTALSLEELEAVSIPEPSFIVDGILAAGSLSLQFAREKTGKCLQAVDLAASVATGEAFLGLALSQGPAILIPLKEHLGDVRKRLRSRLKGRT